MTDEVKEILIDLIGYYNVIGTDDDPGFGPLADIVHRASKALEREVTKQTFQESKRSTEIDPFAMDVLNSTSPFKHENDL